MPGITLTHFFFRTWRCGRQGTGRVESVRREEEIFDRELTGGN